MRCPRSRFPIRIIVFDELELIIFESQGLTLSTARLVLYIFHQSFSSQTSPDVPSDGGAGVQHQGGAVHTEVAVCAEGHSQGTGGAVQTVTLHNVHFFS